jgi:hypothetical protein
VHEHRHPAPRRRIHPGPDRPRHVGLRVRAAAGVVGRPVSRQRPVGRHAPPRQDRAGCKWLDYAPEQAAIAAIRVKATHPAAQYQRPKPRRAHKKALGAVKHTIIVAVWHTPCTGETHRHRGGDYLINRDPERQTKRPVKQLEHLGHHVTLTERAAAA